MSIKDESLSFVLEKVEGILDRIERQLEKSRDPQDVDDERGEQMEAICRLIEAIRDFAREVRREM